MTAYNPNITTSKELIAQVEEMFSRTGMAKVKESAKPKRNAIKVSKASVETKAEELKAKKDDQEINQNTTKGNEMTKSTEVNTESSIQTNTLSTNNSLSPLASAMACVNQDADDVTMTSLDITNMINEAGTQRGERPLEHRNVKASIQRLVKSGAIQLSSLQKVENKQSLSPNKWVEVYEFKGEQGKRDSYVLVAQLSPQFTALLVDRWMELEKQVKEQNAMAIPDFTNPSEAARAWADQFDARVTLALEVKKQNELIEEAKPKIDYYESVKTTENCLDVTEFAAVLNIGRNAMYEWLRDAGYLIASGSNRNLPKRRYMQQGLFEVKQTVWRDYEGRKQVSRKTLITGKGNTYLVNKLIEAGVIELV